MILYIDTTDNDVAEIVLVSSETKIVERWQSLPHAEEFSKAIKKFLTTHGYNFPKISKIAVKVGPGFFSRVRSGVVAANALAYALNIPVVSVVGVFNLKKVLASKGQKIATPVYGAAPNITIPKKQ